jgi:hypothetical protein
LTKHLLNDKLKNPKVYSQQGVNLMTPQFFGREIDVIISGDIITPLSFRLGKNEYEITQILDAWHDYGFGRSPLRHRNWWQRRHRNYYRVKTTGGEIFEIYYDRGTSLKYPELRKWFLYRQL